jgi:hypothetical protein
VRDRRNSLRGGNTYSRLDTERLIQFGQEAEGKDAKETQMILNHKAALELLVQDSTDDIGMNRFTLLNLHALLSDNLMADPEASGVCAADPSTWAAASTRHRRFHRSSRNASR